MKLRLLGFATIAALVVVSLAPAAFGQDDVTVSFSGGGSTTWSGGPDGDVYAGIYNGTVSGIPGANPGIVCDDYKDNVVAGETWTATALDAASLNTSNIDDTLFGSAIGLQGYAEVATLVSDMFSGKSGYTQAELSSAIWYITGGGLVTFASLDGNAQTLVNNLKSEFGSLSNLAAEGVLAQYANLWILTPSPEGPGEAQEMWVSAAEGGAALAYLLLAGFSCCGAMFFRRRRGLAMRPVA